MRLTISVIKADVGSKGGHTEPLQQMIQTGKRVLDEAIKEAHIFDGRVFYTGDDIALVMAHAHGPGSRTVHIHIALKAFREATKIAQAEGLYGAGQDLLIDAPSGNLRGAGPGVAEITFEHEPARHKQERRERPAESVLVFMADKCGPGAYNLPLYLGFADPMYCSGLLLSPALHQGFTFRIIDMDNTESDSLIELRTPEDLYKIALLLRDNERYGIDAIFSRAYPDQQVVSVSAERMHNINGSYSGKDDPVAIVRNQGIFPAPEELMMPWTIGHFTGGGARGGHNMPLMPVPLNTSVTGPYCLPIVSAVGFSLTPEGTFGKEYVDFFGNPVWDGVRLHVQEKAIEMRRQGFSGPAMLGESELEYGGARVLLKALRGDFALRQGSSCKEVSA